MNFPTNNFRSRHVLLQLAAAAFIFNVAAVESAPEFWFPPIVKTEQATARIDAINEQVRGRRPTADEFFELGSLYLLHTPNTGLATNYLRQAVRLGAKNPFAVLLFTIALERRGDYALALPPLIDLCSSDSDGPAVELALRTVRSYQGYVTRFANSVESPLRKLLKRDGLSPQISYLARDIIADILSRDRNPEDYHEWLVMMGRLRKWHVAGPFGHLPSLDFDHPFPPETGAPNATEYDDKTKGFYEDFPEASVRPFGKHRKKGTFYASTWIRTLTSREVLLRLDSADSLKLWIDGRQVFTRDDRREWKQSHEVFAIKLNEGWHRILVKSSSEFDPGGFHLYVTDEFGNPLKESPGGKAEFETLPKPAGLQTTEVSTLPATAESTCDEILASHPNDPWANFVKAWLVGEAGNMVQARVLAEQCVLAAPDFAEFHFYLARYLKDDMSQSIEESSSRSRQEFQKAAELASDFAIAMDEASDFDIDENHPDQAIKTLQNCIGINNYYWGFHLGLFTAYRAKGWNDLATDSLEKAFKLFPDALSLIDIGIKWFRERSDYDRLEDCLNTLKKTDPRSSEGARHYISIGDFKEAAKEYRRLIEIMPRESRFKFALADMYRRMGEIDLAQKALNELLEESAGPATVQRSLATLYFEAGNDDKAREAINAALEEAPTDLLLRQSALELGLEDELAEFRVSLEDVLKERDAKREYPDVSTIYLLDQFLARVFPDGSSIELTHIIAKVLDKGGVQRMGEISIPRGSTIYYLRVLKPDGEVLEPELSTKKASYTMSGLAPGDIVQYEYLTASRAISIPNVYPGANFTFNSIEIPTERAQLVLITAPDFPLNYKFRNAKVKPKVDKRKDGIIYEWNMKNPTAVHLEPLAVPYQEYIPHVQFSGGLEWDSVRRHYYNRLYPRLKVSPEMKADVDKAIEGLTDPTQKAEAIFRLVEEQIKSPGNSVSLGSSAHLIYSMRAGNVLVVLKSMFDYVGIESDVVFTYSLAQALPVLEVPSLATYRYGLLRLRLEGGKNVWLQPSGQKMPFGYVHPSMGGTKGLVISNDGETFIEIPEPPSEQDQLVTRWTGNVSAEGDIDARVEEHYSGSLAGAIRRVEENYTEQQWIQFIERNINYSIPGAEVSSFELLNVDDFKKPVIVKYQFVASDFARREGDYLRIGKLLGRNNMIRRYAAVPGRYLPLLLRTPMNKTIETTLHFPKGSEVKDVPPPISQFSPQGRFDAKVKEEGDVLSMSRSIRLPIQRIPPPAYRSFQNLCRAIDQNELHEIVVQVKGK